MRYSSVSSAAPRQLPRGRKARIIFSSPGAWVGLSFLGLGLIFTLVFAPLSDLNFSNPLDVSPAVTTGTLHSVTETSATENKKKILRFEFDYFVDDKPYYATSYYRGDPGLRPGDPVAVEYDKTNPSFARIKNFRMAVFSGETFLFMLVFPFIGLLLVARAFVRSRKNISLVSQGYLTTGKVVSKAATLARINKRRVYKVSFEFTGTDGMTRQATVKTHQPERLEDDESEMVLVHPDQNEAIMIDALPKAVRRFFENRAY